MLNFLHLLNPRASAEPEAYDRAFVEEVNVERKPPANRRVERVLAIGWILIAVKCVLTYWLIAKYSIPVHPLWVVVPTLIFALLCTAVYHFRK